VRAGDIYRQRRAPALSSNSAAARRSAATAPQHGAQQQTPEVMLTTELARLDTDLYIHLYFAVTCEQKSNKNKYKPEHKRKKTSERNKRNHLQK